ncbi:MAG: type 4a pilus biogenesis protein PilO [Cyanobacteria bacterium P01_H01_bin.15]
MSSFTEDPLNEEPVVEEVAEYPELFGITLTPVVGGILCAIVGILGAGYLFSTQVWPKQEESRQLAANRDARQTQLQQAQSTQKDRLKVELESELVRNQERQQKILSLLSSPAAIDTLLLDINQFLSPNDVTLVTYTPGDPELVTASEYGPLVQNKLYRKPITLELQGTYENLQAAIQDIETLQTLLVMRSFEMSISSAGESAEIVLNQNNELVPTQPPLLRGVIEIDALLPASPQAAVEPEAAPQTQ